MINIIQIVSAGVASKMSLGQWFDLADVSKILYREISYKITTDNIPLETAQDVEDCVNRLVNDEGWFLNLKYLARP